MKHFNILCSGTHFPSDAIRLIIKRNNSILRQSYVHGASNIPLTYRTTSDIFEEQVEKVPDRTLFIFPQQAIRRTYAETYRDARRLANGLVSLGMRKGDRIGMWGPNQYEWVLTQLAASLSGLIFVTINPAYQANELEYCLRKASLKCLIAANSFKKQNFYETLLHVLPDLRRLPKDELNFNKLPVLKSIVFLDDNPQKGAWTFREVLSQGSDSSEKMLEVIKRSIQPDDPANIQFTSGTTGNPKGATLSHFGLLNNAYLIGKRLQYHEKHSIICCPPPLYHCFGCVAGTLSSILHAATCAFPSIGFDSTAALKTVHEEKCNSLYGTPTMFIDMLSNERFNDFNYSSLSTGIMSGASCPKELCLNVIERLNMRNLTIIYGTTENSPATFQSTQFCSVDERVSTVGRVHDHIEAKIVDENGNIVPINQNGELLIRGHCVMLNYWNDEEETKKIMSQDRWYKTGDLASMDETGRLRIVGRKKDMVIRGGENIYPAEIEELLFTHPKILDVQIVGVPDKRLGEELCAWIRLKDNESCSEEEIRQFCREKIAYFKVPRYIMFKKQEEFPVTVTGKIQKYKIRDIATVELHLDR